MKNIKLLFLYAIVLMFTANIAYSLYDKPGQILSPISHLFNKLPSQTWQNYDDNFELFATEDISSTFLAALAQSESGGNPVATVYWRWRWTNEIYKIFHPASSALGLFQITAGTFKKMKNFCWQDGKVKKQGCIWNQFRVRFSSYDSTYLVSAYLNYWVGKYPHYQKKEKMAALIHLCGPQKVSRHMKRYGHLKNIKTCGPHNVATYLKKIRRYQRTFSQLAVL